jgi:Leucine-rich repeat (LRR) protein
MLLLVITTICIVLGWHAARSHRQFRAVTNLKQLEATIVYDYDQEDREPTGPAWLRRLLGGDAFDRVVAVEFRKPELIGDDQARWLGDLPDLKRLWLHQTKVTDAGMAHLRDLHQLEDLVIYGTALTDDGFRHLRDLRKLAHLNMHGLPVGDGAVSHLAQLTNLKTLHASHTRVTDSGLASLANLTQLEVLDLDRTQISDAGLAHLKRLTKLRELSLTGNQITAAGARHLANLVSLEGLALGGCPVDDDAVEHLIRLTKLKRLHLGFVKMTYSGLARLMEANNVLSVYIDGESFADLRQHPDFDRIERWQGRAKIPGFLGPQRSGIELGPALERSLNTHDGPEPAHGRMPELQPAEELPSGAARAGSR